MSESGTGGSYTETTHTSWVQRIKNAIGGVVTGAALVGIACMALFWNEGRAVQTARSLAEGGGAVVSVDATRVDPANEGKLIHISGLVKTASRLMDSEFGISTDGIRLDRTVEMYQWKEEKKTETRKNPGGSEETVTTYTYRREWLSRPEDSSRFVRGEGRRNPEMRWRGRDIVSSDGTVGAFRASEAVLRQISARDALPVDPSLAPSLRERVGGMADVADGRIFIGGDPASPRIGDYRISYHVAKPETLSVIGRQTGNGFAPYQTQAGDQLLMATTGAVPAKDMFSAAERENMIITWLIRFGGMLAIFIGFSLILRPLVIVADFVPLIGSILGAGAGLVSLVLTLVLGPLVIAIAWFYYRPVVAIAILLVGLAAAFGVKILASKRAAARAVPATA